jgi:antitoxin (DNA-binding transcriptional repressor) of toxin-antitoxin stability system
LWVRNGEEVKSPSADQVIARLSPVEDQRGRASAAALRGKGYIVGDVSPIEEVDGQPMQTM